MENVLSEGPNVCLFREAPYGSSRSNDSTQYGQRHVYIRVWDLSVFRFSTKTELGVFQVVTVNGVPPTGGGGSGGAIAPATIKATEPSLCRRPLDDWLTSCLTPGPIGGMHLLNISSVISVSPMSQKLLLPMPVSYFVLRVE